MRFENRGENPVAEEKDGVSQNVLTPLFQKMSLVLGYTDAYVCDSILVGKNTRWKALEEIHQIDSFFLQVGNPVWKPRTF